MSDALWRRLATAVVLVCLGVLGLTAAFLVSPSLRARFGFAVADEPPYSVGALVDVPVDLYQSSPATMLIFARSTCGACRRGEPVFAALVTRVHSVPSAVVKLVSSGGQLDDERAYGSAIGLDTDDVRSVPATGLRFRVVPTLLVVDRAGSIHYASEGIPSAEQQDEITRVVHALAGGR